MVARGRVGCFRVVREAALTAVRVLLQVAINEENIADISAEYDGPGTGVGWHMRGVENWWGCTLSAPLVEGWGCSRCHTGGPTTGGAHIAARGGRHHSYPLLLRRPGGLLRILL